jgi:hypothetical protein
MDHIPMEEIKELWEESAGSWNGLIKSIEARENGNGNEDYSDLITIAKQMEETGEPFPESSEELEEMISENMPAHQHRTAM